MKQIFKIAIFSIILSLLVGCEKEIDLSANLTVRNVRFTETNKNQVLDLPNGTLMIDNPNFDFNNAATWTGNVAKYVKHNYMYSVSYTIKNIGYGTAYGTELDLHYIFDNGEEQVQTIIIGDIGPDDSFESSANLGSTDKQLVGCDAEVFW